MLLPEDLAALGINVSSQTDSGTGKRHYLVQGHKTKYPSVTTLIKRFEPQYGLTKWKQDLGEEADKVSRNAAAVGTKVHKCNECFFDRSPYSVDSAEVLTRHRLFIPILEKITPLLMEKKMYWANTLRQIPMGFGGTPDMVGTFSRDLSDLLFEDKDKETPFTKVPVGSLFVADYKNFLSAKTPDRLLSKYLQAAAYSLAVTQRTGGRLNPMHGFILGTTKTMLSVFYLAPREMAWYQYWFIKLVECYFLNAPFNWGEFSEYSGGYKFDGVDEETGKKIWGKREEHYLSQRLYTPKVSKKDLEELQHPYLTFSALS